MGAGVSDEHIMQRHQERLSAEQLVHLFSWGMNRLSEKKPMYRNAILHVDETDIFIRAHLVSVFFLEMIDLSRFLADKDKGKIMFPTSESKRENNKVENLQLFICTFRLLKSTQERDGAVMLWKNNYELGVPQVDAQHQELFRRVDLFLKVLRSEECWEEKVPKINETLEFMKKYVVEHFHDEEEYQRSINYPGYEAHKRIHNDMVNYVVEVCRQYEQSNNNEELMQQFGGRLLAWLINHVAAEDQRIADYAKRRSGNEG